MLTHDNANYFTSGYTAINHTYCLGYRAGRCTTVDCADCWSRAGWQETVAVWTLDCCLPDLPPVDTTLGHRPEMQ